MICRPVGQYDQDLWPNHDSLLRRLVYMVLKVGIVLLVDIVLVADTPVHKTFDKVKEEIQI